MSLKKAAQQIFKGWATPEEIQEFQRKFVADLQDLGFQDRTIHQDDLPFGRAVTDELIGSGEDNIYHLVSGHYGASMFLCGAAFQPPQGGKKWSPSILYIGLNANRTTAIHIAPHIPGGPGQSFEWKDREKAERAIVEWLAEQAGNDVRAQLGWTDAQNTFLNPKP